VKFFDLAQNKTSVKQEFGAGLTTFLAMMYIVPVNAIIMSKTGMPYEALITATALITIFSTVLNGLWANTPVAMSVGMGLNLHRHESALANGSWCCFSKWRDICRLVFYKF